MVFNFFKVLFTEKQKNSVSDMPIIPQTLNINNLKTASANSINLHTIKKLVKYYLKNVSCKSHVYTYRFWDVSVRRLVLSSVRLVLSSALRGTKSKRVNVKTVFVKLNLN